MLLQFSRSFWKMTSGNEHLLLPPDQLQNYSTRVSNSKPKIMTRNYAGIRISYYKFSYRRLYGIIVGFHRYLFGSTIRVKMCLWIPFLMRKFNSHDTAPLRKQRVFFTQVSILKLEEKKTRCVVALSTICRYLFEEILSYIGLVN